MCLEQQNQDQSDYDYAALQQNTHINQHIVQLLESNRFGLPVEVYCCVNKTNIKDYERAQADLFDHIYSTMKEFNLKTVKPISAIH